MAPPKTMALSQPQQQTIGQNGDQPSKSQNKSKNRKNKQQQRDSNKEQQASQLKQSAKCQDSGALIKTSTQTKQSNAPVVESIERNAAKKEKISELSKNAIDLLNTRKDQSISATKSAKQLINEEADDIDAGIEVDGSSNSGSSFKDGSEDQLKSNSVSPIMAQTTNGAAVKRSSNGISQPSTNNQESAPACPVVTPSFKRTTISREQLAHDRQVIEADEQQIQEKLHSKQRKSSTSGASNGSQSDKTEDKADPGDDAKGATVVDKSARLRRKFSSQSSQESQSGGSLCKVCDQHVYQMERMLAEKSIYHKQCFRCYKCKIQLCVGNYSSHEGQVFCKAHHRQLFQPQAKLDNEVDVDVVAKSRSRQKQMIICENEPAALPDDVVRSDTKVDDGIDRLNLNLNNILERFERGTASNGEDSQPSSASIVIEKPSINLKKTLLAFENNTISSKQEGSDEPDRAQERPAVKRLSNIAGFLNGHNSQTQDVNNLTQPKATNIKRSESLMKRLKKYESRIAGEKAEDSQSDGEEDENNNGNIVTKEVNVSKLTSSLLSNFTDKPSETKPVRVPKLSSFDMSALKNKWESGDVRNTQLEDDDDANGDTESNATSPLAEKNEELCLIRQQLARRKAGEVGSVKNIYENALRERQKKQVPSRSGSSDLSALNGLSTIEIQQQLLQNSQNDSRQNCTAQMNPNKDHFQLDLSNKANKLKEKFELGLITNSHEDSDQGDDEDAPVMSKLEQIRQEKLEDLSVFTDGEIKAREARTMFQQIDRRISAESDCRSPLVNSRLYLKLPACHENISLSQEQC